MAPRRRHTVAAAALATALSVVAMAAGGGAPASAQEAACGPATTATIAALDAQIATNIYKGELGGSETQVDLRHVTSAPDLLSAVAAGDVKATLAAVKRIVYHPFWHIVRLRVLDTAGKLLADFGGPYVIAPVDGVLRADGKVIGSFVMSVQDDVGFTKLETRAVGDPIAIYVNGSLVTSLGATFPKTEPATTPEPLVLGGDTYSAQTLVYNAFPTGTLDALLVVPAPTLAQAAEPCATVSLGETERVVKRIAARFHPLAALYANFVETVHADTGAVVVVRIGVRAIAGTAAGPGALPRSGTVDYEGSEWSVFSFDPTPPARIFVLVPQSPTSA